MKRVRILARIILATFLFLGSTDVLRGGVSVYPTYVFLSAPDRAVSIVVTNNFDVPAEIWVSFRYGYPCGDDSGKIYMRFFDTTDIGEPSGVAWLRAFPQRVVLEAKESQKIRLLVSPPADISAKEYWARVIIHSKDKKVEGSKAAGQPGQSMAGVKLMSNVDIPFHYRYGQVTTGVFLKNLDVRTGQGILNILNDISRTGNASFWGTYKVTLRDQKGKAVVSKEDKIVVYQELRYAVPLDISKVPSGVYTLEIEITSRRRDIRQEYLLATEPLRRNMNVTIP